MGVRYLRRTPRPSGKHNTAPGWQNPATKAGEASGRGAADTSKDCNGFATELACFGAGTRSGLHRGSAAQDEPDQAQPNHAAAIRDTL
jgi:hypothetical protein